MQKPHKVAEYVAKSIIDMRELNDWQQAAVVLLSTKREHKMTYEEIADELGIDRKTLYHFRQRSEVKDYILKFNMARVIDALPEVVEAQVEKAIKGANTNAAELVMKYAGVLVERRAVDANVTAEVTDVSAQDNDALKAELDALRAKMSGQ